MTPTITTTAATLAAAATLAIAVIPKPNMRKRPRKGAIITLTPEQEAMLAQAGFNRSMIFVVGSPISDPLREYPRQETPHQQRKAVAIRSGGPSGMRPRNLLKEFDAVLN